MNLGDRIKLHIERKPTFASGKPDITDGEFIVIGVDRGLPHCFSDTCWSKGFNSFEYGEHQEGRPDIVLIGSVYVPTPSYLDKQIVEDMHFDNKVVSWEVLEDKPEYTIPGFENLEESLEKLTIRKDAKQTVIKENR
jgi:hypothetical protein